MSAHHCHALECKMPCSAAKLMCPKHWAMAPADKQQAVLKHYKRGQCDTKRPSIEWIRAARAAITEVGIIEGRILI